MAKSPASTNWIRDWIRNEIRKLLIGVTSLLSWLLTGSVAIGTQSPEAGGLWSRSQFWAMAGNPGGRHLESVRIKIGSELGGRLASLQSDRTPIG